MLVPVALHEAVFVEKDKTYAEEYLRNTIAQIINKTPDCIQNIEFPLGLRKIKINTVLSLDGFQVSIAGKSNGGEYFLAPSLMPLSVTREQEEYVKCLESFRKKWKETRKLRLTSNMIKSQSSKMWNCMTSLLKSCRISHMLHSCY